MKRELLDILACPVCKGELALTVEKEAEREIIAGALLCRRCGITYPIVDCIPPPAAGVALAIARR